MLNNLIPPHDEAAEKAVLGAMLIEAECVDIVTQILKANDFYDTLHRKIYDIIIREYDSNNGKIDKLIICNRISTAKTMDDQAAKAYVVQLAEEVIYVNNVEQYANIVKEKAMLRELILTCRHILEESRTTTNANETLEKAAHDIFEIAIKRVTKDSPEHIGAIVRKNIDEIERVCSDSNYKPGIPTGYADIDRVIGGLHKQNLIIIAGRPSSGKTTIAINIMENIALQQHKKIAMFSLEMSKSEIAMKVLSSQTKINTDKLRYGHVKTTEWPIIMSMAGKLTKNASIYVDDSAITNIIEIKAKIRRLIATIKQVDVVVIDYLQLMAGSRRTDTRQQEVSEITRHLKLMAKELDVPIVALSQLSRESEKRKTKDSRPKLSDLRDSGSIEQDADVVMMLHRPDMQGNIIKEMESANSNAEVLIEKNRNGRIGIAKLLFMKQFNKFETLENTEMKE